MSSPRKVPLFRVHSPPGAPAAVASVLESGYLADGEESRRFEASLAEWLGTPNVVVVSDISAAITLGLFLAGVKPGDEVIAPPMVCTATTMPIANLFAVPAWGDVDALTGMLLPSEVARRKTAKSRAVVAYHWGGDVAEVESLQKAAEAEGLKLIEDASDALGGEIAGKRIGNSVADFTALSFRATKQLTSGEGGALVCRRTEDAERARWLRRYGIHTPSFRLPNGDLNPASDIPVAGFNFPLINVNAAIGNAQWPHLARNVARLRDNAAYYDRELAKVKGLTLLKRRADAVSGWWTYNLLAERRAQLVEKLTKAGVGSQRLHVRNDVYSCFASSARPQLPGTDAFDAQNVSMPVGWWVTDEDRAYVVEQLASGW